MNKKQRLLEKLQADRSLIEELLKINGRKLPNTKEDALVKDQPSDLSNESSVVESILNLPSCTVQYYKSDYGRLRDDLKHSQLSKEEVISMMKERDLFSIVSDSEKYIRDNGINANLKGHGQRHIIDVTLFSLLIGFSIVDEESLVLLLNAAMYHDSARVGENGEEHALASAEYARLKLGQSLSPRDLAIVCTAIEFHEVPRHLKDVDDIFVAMCRSNSVNEEDLQLTRILSEILKDADALDRTRFINRARLDSRFLYFETSQKLVRFAAELQEYYALLDLEKYRVPEEIEILEKSYTPQEILRRIRKESKGMSPEDFIKVWAREVNYPRM